jgi:tetratricopeptide (TPR) repeat protein
LARSDVVRKTGGFDPKLRYSEDSEFMFRLATVTSFCYVNRPLVWFDRSPAETRHVGASADWNKQDFLLKQSQLRLEGLLQKSEGLPVQVRKIIRENLRSVHSGWANWYLETGQYPKARRAASKALRIDPNFNVALKWLLTWINPQLALRTVRQHQERTKDTAGIV